MGSSNQLPGLGKSGSKTSLMRKSPQGETLAGKATRSSRARPKSSIPHLLDGEARYRVLADQTKDAIFLADAGARRIVDVNAGALRLTGYKRSELIGSLISKLVAPEDREAQRNRVAATGTERSLVSQARFRRKDGSPIDVEIQQRRLADGRTLAVVRAADKGGLAEGQYSQMVTRFDLLVATIDREARISYANAALSTLTGWSVEELIGRPVGDLFPTAASLSQNQPLSVEFWAGNLKGLSTTELVTRSGETRILAVSATLLQDQYGTNVGAALLGQDITQDRAAVTELEREIRERAGAAEGIARLQPGGSTEETALAICTELRGLRGVDVAAVVAFNADGSATVLASQAPDDIRREVSAPGPASRSLYLRERAAMGPWVERWQIRPEDGDYAAPLARAGVHSFSYAPIRYADRTLGLLAVGSLHREQGDPVHDDLPVIAEFGPAASALLGVDLHANQLADELRGRLQEIVRSGAFHPVFQPIVDLATGQVVGYEALTRFADGEPPSARFSAAWSVGSGVELELATLGRAILASRALPPGRWLSVNLSPRLLTHPDEIRAALDQADRPLVLEITEHELIPDYSDVREALQHFSPARISVDDAGAGFTNFAHIVDLQADFVKLDIGLVRGVDTDLARQAMVVALCHFAKNTDCQLIAEGVETRDEARTVKSLGVAFGQGYWYGRPLEADAFTVTPLAP
ncbi:MAG: EAL domain-containing protein [Candidatus Dormiibacterota bacterium]